MKTKILLIEDDAWLSDLYKDSLKNEDAFEVLTANSAEAALEILDTQPGIVMIILDIFLPDHNGVEFLHEVASYSDTVQIPVIVLSSVPAHDFAIHTERWKHYGVVSHLYKPMTKPDRLVTEVKKQLVASPAL
jgi:response regulator of citrate/malate metabolism